MNRKEASFNWTDEKVAELKTKLEEGKSFSIIAAELGCGRSAAIGKSNRMGFKSRNPKYLAVLSMRLLLKAPRPRIRNRRIAKSPQLPVDKVEPVPRDDVATITEISELEADTCHWPVGDPGDPGFGWCGLPVLEDKPYCKAHCDVVYRGVWSTPRYSWRSMRR